MRLRTVPFEPGHLKKVRLGEHGSGITRGVDRSRLAREYAGHPAMTVLCGREVVACMGVVRTEDGRGDAWAYVDHRRARKAPLAFTRVVQSGIASLGGMEIETHVLADFDQARRWAVLLGFVVCGRVVFRGSLYLKMRRRAGNG